MAVFGQGAGTGGISNAARGIFARASAIRAAGARTIKGIAAGRANAARAAGIVATGGFGSGARAASAAKAAAGGGKG